ncbi:MAG: hypothetical protein QY326_06320 [Bdellovibrionota bacterium]|nr:MAG: hypothetical protein QY326_06320 [Bdellovibrionota bacterium]
MTIPEAELQRLLRMGRAILGVPGSSEEMLASLTAFIEGIERLPLSQISSENEDSLRELASLHAQVLAYAGTIKADWAKGLGELRRRGRGILAYADQLPKQLSSRPSKKG